jgi:hypothetical protein
MAITEVNGKVTLPKNGYSGHLYLWELYDLPNGVEAKRKWTLWTQSFPTDILEGTWVNVKGSFSISVAKDIEGKPMTYTDKNGNEITKHDLSLNVVEILDIKEKRNPTEDGVDLDDLRKYGTITQELLNDQPF